MEGFYTKITDECSLDQWEEKFTYKGSLNAKLYLVYGFLLIMDYMKKYLFILDIIMERKEYIIHLNFKSLIPGFIINKKITNRKMNQ